MELYVATYAAVCLDGDADFFCFKKYFSSKSKALDYLRKTTKEDMPRDRATLDLKNVDLYCHLQFLEECEGVYIHKASSVYSQDSATGERVCLEGTIPLLTSL